MIKAEVIIPCYNESESLAELYRQCCKVVEASNNSIHFILVNNGSTDETDTIIQNLTTNNRSIRFIHLSQNQGYGGGILAGLKESTAPIIGWTHSDLQTPLIDCLIGVEVIYAGNDFVKGNRRGRPSLDRVFSKGMGVFETLLFKQKLNEVNAQPTLFKREILESWVDPPSDFSLDLYALVMAGKSGALIKRIDVIFLPRRHGSSKWNIGFKSKLQFIKRTIRYSIELKRVLNEDL